MAETKKDERRRHDRIVFQKEVEVVGVGTFRSADISFGGMYLNTKEALPTGNPITLRFKLYDSDPQPIQVRARVLYNNKGTGAGLGFMDLSSDDLTRIVKFIEQG